MGREAMSIWLRMLKRDIITEGGNNAGALSKVQADIDGGIYTVLTDLHICHNLSKGTLCMYLLHRVITTGVTQLSDLVASCDSLLSGIENRESAIDHCRQMMQFMLAADRLVGDFFSPELLQELDPSLQGGRKAQRQQERGPAKAGRH